MQVIHSIKNNRLLWIAWLLFFVNLLVRGDGTFPFQKSIDPFLFRAIVLSQTIFLFLTCCFLIYKLIENKPNGGMPEFKPYTIGFIIAFSLPAIGFLQIIQAEKFAELGYQNKPIFLFALVVLSCLILTGLWRKNTFLAVLFSAIVLKIYPILFFPITAKRSDMLPIITEACKSIFENKNIYQYYLLDNGVWTQIVRFPGLVLSFIPAFGLELDPRTFLLICEIAFFLIVYTRWKRSPAFLTGVTFLAYFPYWHYRHELYETPFWLVLLCLMMLLDHKQTFLHVIGFSILLSFHQWGLLFFPFLILFLINRTSWTYGLIVTFFSACGAFMILTFACRGQYGAFFDHTIMYYSGVLEDFIQKNNFHLQALYFTPEISRLLGSHGVTLLRCSTQIVLAAFSYHYIKTFSQLCGTLAASLLFLLATNTVAWTYQYLLVGVLIWLGFLSKSVEPLLSSQTAAKTG